MSNNKVLDGILGLCIGDALGVPVEFKNRAILKLNPVKSMSGYGVHNQPPGTWSDDASMTLCTLDSLQYGYNLNDIAERFVKWSKEELWTARGEVFDIGIATSEAIGNLINGRSPKQSGLYGELNNGNGSLMRILGLSYYLKDKGTDEKLQKIREVSSITHGHDMSVFSCIFYVEYAINLLKGKDKLKAYEDTISFIWPHIEKYKDKDWFKNFHRILSSNIHKLRSCQIKSSGFVIHTLEASLWCFLTSKTYEATVLKAVNLGDDADTTAAVAGGLAGILYGIEYIPKEWLNCLARKADIEALCKNVNKNLFS